ncbi:hypothetical protein [Halorussus aquaticus]|uniref:Histidine kinase n=1 Tax=Halorussus aquaticus TaxID=2953748 RepID=A0ABD5Q6X7_9EURY|nr:hypothetical protein [Halorussus aquaticus]
MARRETAVGHERPVRRRWLGGAVAGLLAGVVFGLYLQFVAGVLPATGGSGGTETLASDWAVHLFHSVVFALVYAGLASWPRVEAVADRPATGAILGAGYGVVVWAVAVAVAFAFWAVANGVWVLPIPSPSWVSLAGHVLYGAVLGVGFAAVRSRAA